MLWPQPIITTIITNWKWRASTACEAAKMEVVMVFYPLQLLGGWNFFKVLKRKTRPRCYRSELADPSWNCLPLLGYRTLCEHRHRSRCGKIAFIWSFLRTRQTWRRWRPIRGSWDSSGKSYKLCETFCKRMHSQGGNSWGRRRVSYRNYWLMSKEGPWLMPFGRRPRISQETRFFFSRKPINLIRSAQWLVQRFSILPFWGADNWWIRTRYQQPSTNGLQILSVSCLVKWNSGTKNHNRFALHPDFRFFFFSDAGSHSFCKRARESPLVPCNYRLSSIPVTHTNCWPTGPFLVDQRRRLQILCGGKSPAATLMPCAHQQQTGHKWTYQICFEAQFDFT